MKGYVSTCHGVRLLVVAIALLVSGTKVALADEAPFQKVSIDLEKAPVRVVLESFGQVAASVVEIDPAVKGEVSMTLNEVQWPTLLDAVCESAGCSWSLRGGHPRVLTVVPAESPPAEGGDPLDAAISLSLKSAGAKQTLESYGRILGSEVLIEGELSGSVTFELDKVSARTALDAICDGLGCAWELQDGRLLITVAGKDVEGTVLSRLGEPISLSLKSAALENTLQAMARILGCELEVAPGVEGAVTVELDRVAARAALDQVCAQSGCRWSLQPGTDAMVLRVEPAKG